MNIVLFISIIAVGGQNIQTREIQRVGTSYSSEEACSQDAESFKSLFLHNDPTVSVLTNCYKMKK